MQKAYIVAYCRQNLGDDMFVRTLVRRYPDLVFSCNVPPVYNQAFRMESNLRMPGNVLFFVLRLLNKLKILPQEKYKRIAACTNELVIRIGGSIFVESPTAKKKPRKLYHKNEFIIGANFGPYQTEFFAEEGKKFFSKCVDVCFREKFSYDLFKKLENVRIAPDVLFGYPAYPMQKQGNGVGISLISMNERPQLQAYAEEYYATMAKVCDQLIEQGTPVTLFSFCTAEQDMEAVAEVLAKVHHADRIGVREYSGNIDEMLGWMNKCETIIATRFHAMILGWSMGKKVVPVIYSTKLLNVINDLAYPGFKWNLLGGEIPDVDQIVKACDEALPLENIEELARESEKQFEGLDSFVRKHRRNG